MNVLSRLIDRFCLAIYERGYRIRDEIDRPIRDTRRREFLAASLRRDAEDLEIFTPFVKVWPPSGPLDILYRAKERFVSMPEPARARAVRWAPVYVALSRAHSFGRMGAEQWLVDKGWEAFCGCDLDDDAAAEAKLREIWAEPRQSSQKHSPAARSPENIPTIAAQNLPSLEEAL